jgi:hypothetical protein
MRVRGNAIFRLVICVHSFYTLLWRVVEVGDGDDVRELGLNLASSQEYGPQRLR